MGGRGKGVGDGDITIILIANKGKTNRNLLAYTPFSFTKRRTDSYVTRKQ